MKKGILAGFSLKKEEKETIIKRNHSYRQKGAITTMEQYDILWNTHSNHSKDSMPLGGHDTGCNVWVENNQLCLYFSQSGAFDENGTMLKGGRIRLQLDSPALLEKNFCQHFHLYDGYISVDAGPADDPVSFLLWADPFSSKVHVEYKSSRPHEVNVWYDCWRYRDRAVSSGFERHQCRDYDYQYPGEVITYKDTVIPQKNGVLFYHQNQQEHSVVEKAIEQQGLEEIRQTIPDYQKNRIIGGILESQDLFFAGEEPGEWHGVDQQEFQLSSQPLCQMELTLSLHIGQYPEVSQWEEQLRREKEKGASFAEAKEWWNRYFDTSFIRLDEEKRQDNFFAIGRNYQLFRYMLGCNFYGEFPTKFNGGLFTFDDRFTPDFRAWSGTIFTSQNQRLVYWPLLKSGDFQAMKPQMEYFRRITDVGKARTKHYWNHSGACFYEQGSITGLCSCSEYSWHRRDGIDPGLEDNAYVKMHFSSALEFASMMLEYARYTDENIDAYLDYIVSVVEFYFEHYPKDKQGKLVVFPSTALETYKGKDPQSVSEEEYGCTNPMDVVAGLQCVLRQLLEYLPEGEQRRQCQDWYEKCPDLPIGTEEGKTVFLPAEKFESIQNCELPQLYRVYPYSPEGLSPEEKEVGRNTYGLKRQIPDQDLGYSWHQNGIFAARLSLTEEAFRYLHEKFDDAPKRFPAFWGPGHDYTPDHNHGGSGMIGLQEMLLQCQGEEIHLFPAWDPKVDVHFKLWAPHQTTVECTLRQGSITQLEVFPESREKDIRIDLS